MNAEPLRTVVCGTAFGRFHMAALRLLPEDFTPVGVLARGGDFSRTYAREQGLPLYTSVEQLPAEVDAACVVVGSAVSGGPGGEIARDLLLRGVHVLQEHPVHHDELSGLLRTARAESAVYHLNPFYRHVGSVARFLEAAREMRQRGRILSVDATSALQVLYPLLDILGRALGGLRPWALTDPLPPDPEAAGLAVMPQPYRVLQATVAGVPVTLRVQNQIDPSDGDNHALLWHRLSLAGEGGVLDLADTHGPVLWHPRMHAPRDAHHRLRSTGPGTGHLDEPAVTVLEGTLPPSQRDVLTRVWPQTLVRALRDFAHDVRTDADPLPRGQFDLSVCRLWHEATGRLGRPEIIRPAVPTPWRAADLSPTPTTGAP
ncbi:Gfo/Idh/MocA family oxidoreductase [Nocardiopsis sp. CNT312]|uniref:Gfo/Idh/MocA family oxidoreductase n=1 Tax=Nocardiopsis sp. CNT312 TaxID=1137268 RepID=UPI0004B7606F|nr:Gfo/Idh/MocA family oxidoreductase [Nocardiopsis sp. CNT312]